jgi:NADPH:quinone reductase-like Zn-dependent oxidoreductase
MKAIAWTKYGAPDVLELKEFDKPSPKNSEVLIKIRASSVTVGDCRLRACKVPMGFWLPTRLAFGLIKPSASIIGMDISGEIESVGKDVTLFKKGDEVYGTTGMKLGANAQYICLPERSALVKKPNNIPYEQATAVIFGGLAAIHFLRDKANIQKGQKVLINGASGAVGTASVQLATFLGAEVTGICSTPNVELVKSLGAKYVIDYTQENCTKNKKIYDVILDAVGNLSLSQCKKSLTEQGVLVLMNTGLLTNVLSLFKQNLICGVAGESKGGLDFLRERVEAGDIKAVIDKVYPLEQIVEAHRYVDKRHKKGSVVLFVEHTKI